jgi:YbbR domain-containing protein
MLPWLRLLRRNLPYKLISLAMAILLYVVAYTQRNPRIAREIYVQPEVRGVPANMVVRDPPQGIRLRISGPAPAVEALYNRGIKATVNASGLRAGPARLPVEYDLPRDLEDRVELTGAQVAVFTLAQKMSKRFPVEASYVNQAPFGYVFKEPIVEPPWALVAGLASDVNRVQRVVASVDTSGAAGAIDMDADLVAQDADQRVVDNVEISPSRARVEIPLKEDVSTKRLVLSPVFQGEVAPGFRFVGYAFKPGTVTAAGPPELLAALTSLEVPVNREGLSADTTRTLTLRPPAGLRIVDSPQVAVTIQVRPDVAAPKDTLAPPGPPNIPD